MKNLVSVVGLGLVFWTAGVSADTQDAIEVSRLKKDVLYINLANPAEARGSRCA